jgi:hypothetical protein
MPLRETIFADIDAVFLNTGEFAEEVTINGITLKCVPDEDDLTERQNPAALGTYRGEKTVFVKAADLPGKPSVESRITFRGEPHFLVFCQENFGMYELRLTSNRT